MYDTILYFVKKIYLTRVKSDRERVALGEGRARIACAVARKATHGVMLLYFQHT